MRRAASAAAAAAAAASLTTVFFYKHHPSRAHDQSVAGSRSAAPAALAFFSMRALASPRTYSVAHATSSSSSSSSSVSEQLFVPTDSPARVVIIGGGYAGSATARLLEKNANVKATLIDESDAFVFSPSLAPLLTVTDGKAFSKQLERVRWRHADYMKRGSFLLGRAVDVVVDPPRVLPKGALPSLTEGRRAAGRVLVKASSHETSISPPQELEFDILVICSGSTYPAPWKGAPERTGATKTSPQNVAAPASSPSFDVRLREWREKLARAKSVAIIGGGPVGVEMAGALLATPAHERAVVVVHGHDRLLHALPETASEYAFRHINERGGQVLLNTRVANTQGNAITLDSGNTLSVDVIVPCAGLQPNPDFAVSSFGKVFTPKWDPLQSTNGSAYGYRLQVEPTLMVRGQDRVFACGDVCELSGDDRYVVEQVKTVVKNVNAVANSIVHEPMAVPAKINLELVPVIGHRYKVLSLGPDDGIEIRDDDIIGTGAAAARQKRWQERVLMWMFWLGIST